MVILLAEDDVDLRSSVSRLLHANGFTVLTAGDGQAALEVFRDHPGSIDLMLSDVEMPRMGGLELCKTAAAERPGIKVLMMTGALRGREQLLTSGLPFLQKPFTLTALRDSIAALLGPQSRLAMMATDQQGAGAIISESRTQTAANR